VGWYPGETDLSEVSSVASVTLWGTFGVLTALQNCPKLRQKGQVVNSFPQPVICCGHELSPGRGCMALGGVAPCSQGVLSEEYNGEITGTDISSTEEMRGWP
jgi:hypothetical protein